MGEYRNQNQMAGNPFRRMLERPTYGDAGAKKLWIFVVVNYNLNAVCRLLWEKSLLQIALTKVQKNWKKLSICIILRGIIYYGLLLPWEGGKWVTYWIITGVRKRSKTGKTGGTVGRNLYITTFSCTKVWHTMSHTIAHWSAKLHWSQWRDRSKEIWITHKACFSIFCPKKEGFFILFIDNPLYSVYMYSILFSLH